jgi:DnaJ-class molecular chaperone
MTEIRGCRGCQGRGWIPVNALTSWNSGTCPDCNGYGAVYYAQDPQHPSVSTARAIYQWTRMKDPNNG